MYKIFSKNVISFTFIFLLSLTTLKAQVWEKNYGGDSSDVAEAIIPVSTGGYLVAGHTKSYGIPGYDNIYIIRLDLNGDTLWTKVSGGSGNERITSVIEDASGNFVLCGYRYSAVNNADIMLIKMDGAGNIIWDNIFDHSNSDIAHDLVQKPDGKYAITGSVENADEDGFLLVTSLNGDSLFMKIHNTGGVDRFYTILHTPPDGGFLLAGNSTGASVDYQAYIVKTTPPGDTVWTRFYGGSGTESIYDMSPISDSTLILSGSTTSFSGNIDGLAMKINVAGDSIWAAGFGGSGTDNFMAVQRTSEGTLAFAGKSTSFGPGFSAFYLVKTDFDGNLILENTFGNELATDYARDFIVEPDGGLVFCGASNAFGQYEDFYIIKTGPFGNPFYNEVSGTVYTKDSISYDKGEVKLFRLYPNQEIMAEVQDVLISPADGSYQFQNVEGGYYLILAFPDIDSDPLMMPAYYGNVISWWDAVIVEVDDTLTGMNIYLNEMPPPSTTGKGKIYGYIKEGNINGKRMGPGDPLKGINVSILDKSSGSVILWDESDSTGKFSFTAVEAGTYDIIAEVPGLKVDTVNNTFNITEEQTLLNVVFTVDSDMVKVGITDSTGSLVLPATSDHNFSIFPNPATAGSRFYVNTSDAGEEVKEIRIVSPEGRKIFHQKRVVDNRIILPDLSNGVYFIEILTEKGVYSKKLLIMKP